MYADILIPTDASELAGKAVNSSIALAKRIGAKGRKAVSKGKIAVYQESWRYSICYELKEDTLRT
jgi:hypothetical protein